MTVNKVILVGNLGRDPEVRYMPSGGAVAKIALATTESWKDKQTGERNSKTEWHNIEYFNKTAEVCEKYLHKGSKIYVEGSLATDKWTDKQGNDRYTTKIKGLVMQMLDSKGDSQPAQKQQPKRQAPKPEPVAVDDFDSDIPF